MQTVVLETITPEMAMKYLEYNVNRKLQIGYATRLAASMRRGEWRLTHQGIAFNCDGSLRDGQHRLTAIVLSGVPVQMWVTRGVSNDAALVMDTHKGRSDSDAFGLMGFPVEQRAVSMSRSAKLGMSRQGDAVSRDELLLFMKRHENAIAFVLSRSKRSTSSWPFPAVVMAPVIRAYYHEDHTRLGEFVAVMFGKTPSGPPDSAAHILCEFLSKRKKGGVSSGVRGELYRKTQSALVAFLEHRPLEKLYAASGEEWPLPEEQQ